MRSVRLVILSAVGFALVSALTVAQTTVSGAIGVKSNGTALPLKQRPDTFGTTNVSYYVIDSSEMSPIASVNQYSCINNCQLRYLTNASGLGLWAPLHLPAGALVTYLELDYFDNSATGEVQASFAVCDYTGQNCTFQPGNPGCPDAPIALCSGNAAADGYFNFHTDMTPDNIVIDNFLSRYAIAVGNTTNDGSTAISQIIVGYKLQVSPAPGASDFADVPTSDFGFQYIEALFASGITGGCGGGNYCPDAPVTRRQMAIFIAKALGLQWQ